ncbi:MAG: penicillin-binding protein 2 [Gammaproteobacteria bacterium]|nr:penicillin-binding protein 2 [Gammaproteobacteria bacterium]MCY4278849.1 penicillin-binding protein 2 [Gammaproteobacteria bacterium]MCY4323829.1 penicillin-binding protein 2 [Gammaproteobacteria bacterium]
MTSQAADAPGIEPDTHSLRTLILFVGMVALLMLLLFRFIQLQVFYYEKFALRSDSNRIIERPLEPIRGMIFDRDGVPLATSNAIWTLSIVREEVPDLEALLARMSDALDLTQEDIDRFNRKLRQHRRPYEPIALKFGLTLKQRAVVAVDRFHLPGVRIESRKLRDYPFGRMFAHAIGSVRRISSEDYASIDRENYRGAEYIGKLGLESRYESTLRGELGEQTLEVRASGRVTRPLEVMAPLNGRDIHTELSAVVQRAAVRALGTQHGAIVAIDPRDGAIRALVSAPSYDPNLFVTGLSAEQYASLTANPKGPLFNRAVAGLYAPGSTVKPIIGLAGVAHQQTDWERTIYDPGYFRLPGSSRRYRDWTWRPGGIGGHGEVDLHRAIYRSANVYFFDMASRMPPSQLTDFLYAFGFGRVTSIDVPGAVTGLVPTPDWKLANRNDDWRPGDSLNMSIGQGALQVTPLQLATATAIIARRGEFVRPYLFRGAKDNGLINAVEAPMLKLPSKEDYERMVGAMRAVIHRGSMGAGQNGTAWAYIGMDIPYSMAGKSGTSQVVRQEQGEYVASEDLPPEYRNHAWFVAFAPTEAPSIAVAVLVEHGGSGSRSAAPVARAVIDAWMETQV